MAANSRIYLINIIGRIRETGREANGYDYPENIIHFAQFYRKGERQNDRTPREYRVKNRAQWQKLLALLGRR
jgi:hypothetical protein